MNARTQPDASVAVSVVVAARNAAGTIEALLESLERQTLPRERFEVVVVDDASDDATPRLVGESPIARLVAAPRHVGLPAARNLGIAACRGSIVALTDADCIPDREWLERGLSRFDEKDVDLVAGGITIALDGKPTLAALLDASRHLDQERYVAHGFGAGANLWVRRRVFEEVGTFNERIAAYGGDDVEFGQLATASGARLVLAPEVHVTHPPRMSFRSLARKAWLSGKSRALLERHARRSPGMPRRWRDPRSWLPRRRILGLERLPARGVRLTTPTRLAMHLAQHLFVTLPEAAGDLVGSLTARRRPPGGARAAP